MTDVWTSIAVSVATFVLQAAIGKLLEWGESQRSLARMHAQDRQQLIDQRNAAEKRANEFANLIQELQDKLMEQDRLIQEQHRLLKTMIPPVREDA